ncbi:MAG TPA: TetR/AcrR family transcriptional regulator [Ktedonobacteraceae bacterium]|jgi:TetR/AcrR family transcriptional repressor of lmrAB and yxaGH operons|nr:TetR/AcrR family transcriptional regulator [Ktedonobacteraceae bacterium]
MASTRDQIIETTCTLLEAHGYHATGLNQIIAESGSPKGSLYYYFPKGKEELTAAAVERSGRLVEQNIRAGLANIEDPAQAIASFVRSIARGVELSNFSAGGPLTMVAMETVNSSERLNLACRQAYGWLCDAFAEKLLAGGFTPERAASLATFVVSAIEGGIILSRTNHNGDPLRQVAVELGAYLRSTPKT